MSTGSFCARQHRYSNMSPLGKHQKLMLLLACTSLQAGLLQNMYTQRKVVTVKTRHRATVLELGFNVTSSYCNGQFLYSAWNKSLHKFPRGPSDDHFCKDM